jgi:hypothetical protein
MKTEGKKDNKGKGTTKTKIEKVKMMFLMEKRERSKTKTNSQRKSCRTSKTFRRKIDANSEIVKQTKSFY